SYFEAPGAGIEQPQADLREGGYPGTQQQHDDGESDQHVEVLEDLHGLELYPRRWDRPSFFVACQAATARPWDRPSFFVACQAATARVLGRRQKAIVCPTTAGSSGDRD